MAEPANVDGTLVQELGEAMLRIRVERPAVSELKPGDAVALRLANDDPDRHLGVVLSIAGDDQVTVLLDRVAMTEQTVHGGQSGRVPGLEEALGIDPRYG